MVDIMTFPDTVEEFMEQYKMIDRDQIYSNGVEYVPIFRMEQWFRNKKGEWITEGCIEKCNRCGERKEFPHWRFCPNCGADMRGETDDEIQGKK